MEGLLNGRGDLTDNIRMLQYVGAKYIARSICLRGGEADLLLGSSGNEALDEFSEMVYGAKIIFTPITSQVYSSTPIKEASWME
jgi:hypothetical protein